MMEHLASLHDRAGPSHVSKVDVLFSSGDHCCCCHKVVVFHRKRWGGFITESNRRNAGVAAFH